MRHTVKSKLTGELVTRTFGFGLGVIHTAEIELVIPHRELKLEVGETSLFHFLAEPFQGIHGLVNATDTFDESSHLINHKNGLAVNLVIVRLLEKHLDIPLADLLELLSVNSAPPDDVVSTYTGVPAVVNVMVRPHQVELHLVTIRGLEETLRKGCLHERPSVEPVPGKDEHIDPVTGSLLDLHLHNSRVSLIDIPPKRMTIPIVARIALLHCHNSLPFSPIHRPEWFQARLTRRISRIKIGGHIILFLLNDRLFTLGIQSRQGHSQS